jgi:hypothetical protein
MALACRCCRRTRPVNRRGVRNVPPTIRATASRRPAAYSLTSLGGAACCWFVLPGWGCAGAARSVRIPSEVAKSRERLRDGERWSGHPKPQVMSRVGGVFAGRMRGAGNRVGRPFKAVARVRILLGARGPLTCANAGRCPARPGGDWRGIPPEFHGRFHFSPDPGLRSRPLGPRGQPMA